MWGEFCNHYPLTVSNENKTYCEMPTDIMDRGTIKEYKFLNYIIKIYKQ